MTIYRFAASWTVEDIEQLIDELVYEALVYEAPEEDCSMASQPVKVQGRTTEHGVIKLRRW